MLEPKIYQYAAAFVGVLLAVYSLRDTEADAIVGRFDRFLPVKNYPRVASNIYVLILTISACLLFPLFSVQNTGAAFTLAYSLALSPERFLSRNQAKRKQ